MGRRSFTFTSSPAPGEIERLIAERNKSPLEINIKRTIIIAPATAPAPERSRTTSVSVNSFDGSTVIEGSAEGIKGGISTLNAYAAVLQKAAAENREKHKDLFETFTPSDEKPSDKVKPTQKKTEVAAKLEPVRKKFEKKPPSETPKKRKANKPNPLAKTMEDALHSDTCLASTTLKEEPFFALDPSDYTSLPCGTNVSIRGDKNGAIIVSTTLPTTREGSSPETDSIFSDTAFALPASRAGKEIPAVPEPAEEAVSPETPKKPTAPLSKPHSPSPEELFEIDTSAFDNLVSQPEILSFDFDPSKHGIVSPENMKITWTIEDTAIELAVSSIEATTSSSTLTTGIRSGANFIPFDSGINSIVSSAAIGPSPKAPKEKMD